VLPIARVERPVPQKNEVRIRVKAAGLDRGQWHLMPMQGSVRQLTGVGIEEANASSGSGPAAQRRELDAREQSVRLMFGNRPLLPTRMGRWRRLPSRSHWRRVLILSSPGQSSCFNIAHEGNSVAMRRRTPGDI